MNEIFLVSNNLNKKFYLDFKTDNLKDYENENIFWHFEIISHDKLLIFWENSEIGEIFFTDDSYIYYSSIHLKDKFKKYFLIHNEWNDQIILNTVDKTFFRINYKNETGLINFFQNNENKIKIIWKNWGEEDFIKYDEFTYIKENYELILDESINNEIIESIIPIHIFIHICAIENWESILDELINIIKKSGLYKKIDKIHLGILGNIDETIINSKIDEYENKENEENLFNILYINDNINSYEIPTINEIKSFCQDKTSEIYILYLHTKGVRKAGNDDVTKSWRNMMCYFLIENYDYCIKNLIQYDTIGNNIVNNFCTNDKSSFVSMDHTLYYSGNFWWSKKSYINNLPFLNNDDNRYKAENWILSLYPNTKIGILFQDNTNTHPYHRYIFDYYKNININNLLKNFYQ